MGEDGFWWEYVIPIRQRWHHLGKYYEYFNAWEPGGPDNSQHGTYNG
jgi:hypothetical protein